MRMMKYIVGGIVGLAAALVALFLWASSGALSIDQLATLKTYPAPIAPDREVFTVMTYNIGYAAGLDNNQAVTRKEDDFSTRLEQIGQVIGDVKPDIVALQEVDFSSRRSFAIQQVDQLVAQLGFGFAAQAVSWDKHYVPFPPGSPAFHFGRIVSGQAVLSSYPLSHHQRHVLPRPPNPWYRDAFYLNRLVQVVQVDASQPILVINAHLDDADISTRQQQVAELQKLYRQYKDEYPVLILGDFNAVPTVADIRYDTDTSLEALLTEDDIAEVLGGVSGEYTYRADTPDRRLDHIFYNKNFITPLSAGIVGGSSSPPSDHRAIFFRFRLR